MRAAHGRSGIGDGAPGGVRDRACTPPACTGPNARALYARAGKTDEAASEMARPEGFEPPTNGFGSHYSIRLSYGRVPRDDVRRGRAFSHDCPATCRC